MPDPVGEYSEASVAGESQLRLIIMLYEAAVRFVVHAKGHIQQGKIEQAHLDLLKAKRIVVHLLCTTDPESGELAVNLHKLYVFLFEKLAAANMKKSCSEIDDALRILNKLLDGWKQLEAQTLPGVQPQPPEQKTPALSVRA